MPFAVSYADAGIKRREFDAYMRLLNKRGIDWSNTTRVLEPGTDNRWLHLWQSRQEAEQFCEELKAETRDDKWYVRELAANTATSPGSLARVVIFMRRHSLGADFSLHPHSRTLIKRRFPKAVSVSSVSIEWTTRSDGERVHGSIWDHIAVVLTGLTLEQLSTLDGYQVYDLMAECTLYDSQLPMAV